MTLETRGREHPEQSGAASFAANRARSYATGTSASDAAPEMSHRSVLDAGVSDPRDALNP